jgi:gamma-hexachlorocyclohexane dehydrochlorinase
MAISAAQSVEERIDAIESRFAIDRLVSDYCHGCDKKDIDRFMSIWHEDAVWEIGPPYGDFHGGERIRHAMEDLVWGALPETHHWTTNLVVDFESPDLANGVCDVTCEGVDTEGKTILIAATYNDRFERRDGRWAIALRHVDLFYFKPIVLEDADATPEIED